MSNTIELETCPLCGSKLTSSDINADLMQNLHQLKNKGVLEYTLITAVSIVQTMSDNNPVWLRDLLAEQKTDVKKILTENKDELAEYIDKKIITEIKLQELYDTFKTISESSGSNNEAMIELVKSMEKQYRQNTNKSLQKIMDKLSELRGSPQELGKLQEIAIVKRLSAMKLGEDSYKSERANNSLEDVECIVREKGQEIGTIVIESKKTKKWSSKFLAQVRRYMDKKGTQFGILVTKSLPDDALTENVFREGILIVPLENLEIAYTYARKYLILGYQLESHYQSRNKKTSVKERILQELRDSISNGDLDKIIKKIDDVTLDIDEKVRLMETYIGQRCTDIRKNTDMIRRLSSQLLTEHISEIRTKIFEGMDSNIVENSIEQSTQTVVH